MFVEQRQPNRDMMGAGGHAGGGVRIPGRVAASTSIAGLLVLSTAAATASTVGTSADSSPTLAVPQPTANATAASTALATVKVGTRTMEALPSGAAETSACPVPAPTIPTWNDTYCGPPPPQGNGDGPEGQCTGHELTPPCGLGAVPGQYYAYSLPIRCGGQILFDGKLWDSELPPPVDGPPIDVWMRINATATEVSFIAPTGAVAFEPDHGQPLPPCQTPPSPPPPAITPIVPTATASTTTTTSVISNAPTPAPDPEGQGAQMLDAVILPSGALQVASMPGSSFAQPSLQPGCDPLIDETRYWQVSDTPQDVASFLAAHAPPWISNAGSGQSGNVNGGPTSYIVFDSPKGPGWDVSDDSTSRSRPCPPGEAASESTPRSSPLAPRASPLVVRRYPEIEKRKPSPHRLIRTDSGHRSCLGSGRWTTRFDRWPRTFPGNAKDVQEKSEKDRKHEAAIEAGRVAYVERNMACDALCQQFLGWANRNDIPKVRFTRWRTGRLIATVETQPDGE